ncbi:Rossmann-like and DUF2520 domain-containing protein [Agrococcus sp. SGAir0287]|uniref:Rossmann-like and DUF2520 domain-containing protein n=1 Tax=Agrococcus sp. SGAir0287 TaxID=2070347 RepID=UPI0010CCEC79|nr:DUF2520 domain-containing protein [Agrococcus sp. SGAir0287]QCR20149.1 DUF2520 domain-containing protein [Agrococcus sp. SGAir0287]
MTPARLGVGIVGAGRVGPVLAAALAGVGHALVGISGGGDRVEAMLPGLAVLDVPTIVERAELVILAVPTSELPALVAGLAATEAWQPGQLVVHTAAEHGVEVLEPARAAGAIPLAIHPAMAFTGTSLDLARLRDAVCAVTAPAPVLPIAQALVVELGAEPVVVAEADRADYAEAVAMATETGERVVGDALARLAAIGVDRPVRLLGPVVRSSVERALSRAPGHPEADTLGDDSKGP